ncbi:hypothetical protein PHJA_001403300 [Phtheirospermum japonicum]|uniref:Late embryogenesis abundant protein n=1 Tax=Phtheirospermum japonicum TaxID=374723 RepID=A0A830CE72_9LAMI|nr:hypothetical protein PHJA_001403300 [Phtheirospermum japonicum]
MLPPPITNPKQMKKKKRMKCLAYIAALAIIQAIIIAVFVLVIVRVRTPRVRLVDVRVANNVVTTSGNVRLTARVSVRNRNFGRYEFDSGLANIRSGNTNVGNFVINDGRVRARSTRRFYVMIPNLSGVNSNSSVLDLNVEARLRGKVRTLWVIRRNRSARLNCRMTVNLSNNDVQNLRCD